MCYSEKLSDAICKNSIFFKFRFSNTCFFFLTPVTKCPAAGQAAVSAGPVTKCPAAGPAAVSAGPVTKCPAAGPAAVPAGLVIIVSSGGSSGGVKKNVNTCLKNQNLK